MGQETIDRSRSEILGNSHLIVRMSPEYYEELCVIQATNMIPNNFGTLLEGVEGVITWN